MVGVECYRWAVKIRVSVAKVTWFFNKPTAEYGKSAELTIHVIQHCNHFAQLKSFGEFQSGCVRNFIVSSLELHYVQRLICTEVE